YGVDPRGLQVPINIRDQFTARNPEAVLTTIQNRAAGVFWSQMSLRELAESTGGFLVKNTNDIVGGLRRIADDLRGYYLIAYRPDESTFDARTGRARFHRLTVRVKRPGLQVRSRSGFAAVPGAAGPLARDMDMAQALVSPFDAEGVRVRLTPLFANDPALGSFMHSLIHVDARDLTFTVEPDGSRKAVLDVIGVTFGDNGQIADRLVNSTYTLRVRAEDYERLLRNGFVYTADFPVKKPGAYQLRFSLRDAASRRIGSAAQYIVVPDLGDKRLTLSGVILRGGYPEDAARANETTAPGARPGDAANAAQAAATETDLSAGPAVRRFRPGMALDYTCLIYDARADSPARRPQLLAQVRLLRDGEPIYTGKQEPVASDGQQDLQRIGLFGRLRLDDRAAPGEYVLQIVVTDLNAPEKQRAATRSIDFEIVK
ncbi:MAG: hypothetical protein ABR563_04670, partial [Pyrinomonadaceae bacterium]